MKNPPRWLRPADDAPEWAKGDFPWYTPFVLVAPVLVLGGPLMWLSDRTGAARLLVLVLAASSLRWLAWVLPRIRRDPPPSGPD